MNDKDGEFILFDRLEKIKSINKKYDLENNAFIAFSGGKDSTVLHYLIDLALPGNQIPRLNMRTPFEYFKMRKFVNNLQKDDQRIIIIPYKKNIKQFFLKNGYPFKSKIHSNMCQVYQSNKEKIDNIINTYQDKFLEMKYKDDFTKLGNGRGVALYYCGLSADIPNNKLQKTVKYRCPNILKYQFTDKVLDMAFKISDKCCYEMKETPGFNYARKINRPISITGLLKEEGGRRENAKCTVFSKDLKLKSFAPLSIVTKEWEEWFIKKYNVQLCELYYPPYNFDRTGCKGCPYALNLQHELDTLYNQQPEEYRHCKIIWKPVYDEYIRLGYRLKYYPDEVPNVKKKKLF